MDFISLMGMTNVTQCDPCLTATFPLYPLYLVLPTLIDIPIKCFVFWTQSSSPLSDKTDVSALNIFLIDFLLSLSCVITAITRNFDTVFYTFAWSLTIGLLTFGHPLFHCMICVERYMAVECPVVFLKYRPLRYRFTVLAVAWVLTIAVKTSLIGICSSDQALIYEFLSFECVFLAALVCINSFACLSIMRALMRPSPGDKRLISQNGKSKKDGNNIKRNAFLLVSGIQINMLIVYVPPIGLFMSGVMKKSIQFCYLFLFNVWYILIVSGIHALLYLRKIRKLQLK